MRVVFEIQEMADGTKVVGSEVLIEALQNFVKVGRTLLEDAEKDIAQGNLAVVTTFATGTLAIKLTVRLLDMCCYYRDMLTNPGT